MTLYILSTCTSDSLHSSIVTFIFITFNFEEQTAHVFNECIIGWMFLCLFYQILLTENWFCPNIFFYSLRIFYKFVYVYLHKMWIHSFTFASSKIYCYDVLITLITILHFYLFFGSHLAVYILIKISSTNWIHYVFKWRWKILTNEKYSLFLIENIL